MTIQDDAPRGSMRPVYRMLSSSPRVLFALVILSPLHTISPHIYNWYLAEFASCKAPNCKIAVSTPWGTSDLPGTLGLLCAFMVLALLMRALFWAVFEIKASELMQQFFQQVVERLRHVRATWFDEHPSGKLINRLFGDFGSLQRRFIFSLSDGQVCYYELLVGIVMVVWINPWGAVPIMGLWAAVFWAQVKVNPAFEHVSALSSKRKGRVIEVLSDVIEGAPVYRSYQAEDHILERLRERIADWVRVEVFQWRVMTWAWSWMWLLAEAGIAIVVFSAAWALQAGYITAAVAGMILMAAGQQQSIIPWTLDNIGGFLTSRAKALRFLSLGQLPDETHDEHLQCVRVAPQDPGLFPQGGQIVLSSLTGSYRRESPLVLKELHLTIPQGSRLALVGRTGSGKSTIIQALFRMLHIHAGDITIDGVSIYQYPPDVTRSVLGIVPQNPWLFAGTLRENLDLKGEFSEQQLRTVLDELDLQHFRLEAEVEESGRNFSVGERQMICLARCLLSDKRIIVMDEPTSNIDVETDAQVQKMIRTKLTDRTLIVIAHRKETIADFEMIFSLDRRELITRQQLQQEVLG
jgi:ABC-type multidrug transport system fused ATPase/permease subunit